MTYTFQQIAALLKGEVFQQNADAQIRHLAIDSRLPIDADSLFVALKGPRHNGHAFLTELYERGIRNFLVSEPFDASQFSEANVIKVEKEGIFALDNPIASLISKTYLTPDTIELIFSCEDFIFTPGQYVSLQMSDIRGDFSRSYSIASATKTSFTLTVKLLKK